MTMATLVGHRLFGRSTMTARFALTSARYTSATTTITFPLLSATRSHTGSRLHSTAAASAADHPISPREPVDIRTQLLDAALVHVGSLGWTKDTLAAGARDLGLSPASHGILSGGAVELVYHWMDKGNADLEAYLTDNAQLDTNDDTTAADYERQVLLKGLRHRLAYTKPVVWTWPQAMALGAEPHNLADTLARLSQISDLVCRFADDANTQGSGKQGAGLAKHPAAVGAAYAAAELYMLTDYSEKFEDTWAFLERRIDDAGSVSQNASGLLSVLGAAATGAQAVASGVRSLDPTSAMPGVVGSRLLPLPPLPRPSQVKSLAMMVRQASFDTAAMTGNQTLMQALRTIDQHVSPFGTGIARDVKDNVDVESSSSSKTEEMTEKELVLERVVLPDDQSLFGLLAMDISEAAKMVRESNPDFTVLEWPAKDKYEVLHEPRVVRLMFNKNNVVVDVSRG